MWQSCPICKGTGKIYTYNTTSVYDTCNVCNGMKIISTITGFPPSNIISNEDEIKTNIKK